MIKEHINSYDTLHLYIKDWQECVTICSYGYLEQYSDRKPIRSGFNKMQFCSDIAGNLSAIKIQISAKILGTKYFEGINRNNIKSVLMEINRSQNIFEIYDYDKFIEKAIVNRADICKTIESDCNVSELIQNLMLLMATSNKIFCESHKNNKQSGINNGVTISLLQNKKLVCYDKKKDLVRNNDEKLFPVGFDDKKEYIKLELQLHKSKRIKELFVQNNLLTLLNNSSNDFLLDILKEFESSIESSMNVVINSKKDIKYRLDVEEFADKFKKDQTAYLQFKKNELDRNGYNYFKSNRWPHILRLSDCSSISCLKKLLTIMD